MITKTYDELVFKLVPVELTPGMIIALNDMCIDAVLARDVLPIIETGYKAMLAASPTPSAEQQHASSFQSRVHPWLMECFGEMIAGDKEERNHRFLEESLELVQAAGCTQGEAHQLVDYVYGRPIGELGQEVGGVMVTLAALCLANGADMHTCAEAELSRIWTKVDKIRAKQAAKPKYGPLPMHAEQQREQEPDYKSMFMSAVVQIAEISNALGIDADDAACANGNDLILAAIARKNASILAAITRQVPSLAELRAKVEALKPHHVGVAEIINKEDVLALLGEKE